MKSLVTPRFTLDELATWGTENLTAVIAIDSPSDERSGSIPSTAGQRHLADHLAAFFGELGYDTRVDEYANLIAYVPARHAAKDAPAIALMVHLDTAEGTRAVPSLERLDCWDGSRISFPANPRLTVSVADYPELEAFVGHDLLHGPGDAMIGLDDKLGMAELMTLAQALARDTSIPHPELMLVFRPDEEIGRMEATAGIAAGLAQAGVRYGYTIDGILPFEVNVENFNASRAVLRFDGRRLGPSSLPLARRLAYRLDGVKSHGATARAEGYRNALRLFVEAVVALGARDDVAPIDFDTDHAAETSADVAFLVRGRTEAALDAAQRDVTAALEAVVAPHARRGAVVSLLRAHDGDGEPCFDAIARVVRHLTQFAEGAAVTPLWSEESDGHQGYSNPYAVTREGDTWTLSYRLRDFDPVGLRQREAHVRELASQAADGPDEVRIEHQYRNMGSELAPYPELATWAERAAETLGIVSQRRPIRGGTGVDRFLSEGIPVANLGTGYFGPESEKELTSRQILTRHAQWLVQLVQTIANAGGEA